MEHAVLLWTKTKDLLKEKITSNTLESSNKIGLSEFNDVIMPIEKIHKVANNYIYLIVSTSLVKFRINKFYLQILNDCLTKITDENLKFQLITEDEAKKEQEENNEKKLTTVDKNELVGSSRSLRPEYTFENFVAGPSNRFAFITALNVAESPHVSTMNPLYIFGDVGLGKTHLMMAIGWYILSNNIKANVVYTTAQQFADEYFQATRKNSDYTIEQFYNYYHQADVLLVDDIQFLANKNTTQEEFFKLFEYLHEKNKQIVITSDRPATELDIMDRLKSRFSWGIPVDIRKPNFELRKNIARKKLAFLISDPSVVSDEILEYISTNFDENVRELEGALRRFVSYCVAFNVEFI